MTAVVRAKTSAPRRGDGQRVGEVGFGGDRGDRAVAAHRTQDIDREFSGE